MPYRGGMEYEYEAALHGVYGFGVEIFEGNGLAVKEDGSGVVQSYGCYEMTHLAPKWHALVKSGMLRFGMYGDSVAQDNIVHGVHYGYGNFDDWTNLKFVKYMTEKFTADELAKMGFDPEGFHIRLYLASKRRFLTNEALILEPVIHEFIRFHYVEVIAALVDIHEQIRLNCVKAGRPVAACYGNQASLHNYRTLGVSLSEHVDVVWIEDSGWISEAISDIQKKQAGSTLIYKVGRASGHFEKPVWGAPHAFLKGMVNKRCAQGLSLAEAQANGGVLFQGLTDWKAGEPGWDANRHHAQFVSRNRVLFTDRKPIAKVAVAKSVPSLFWRWFSSLEVERPHLDHLSGAARFLEESHIPYEIIILGHPDIFDDMSQLSRLERYETLILPNVDAISDKQVAEISKWVRNGGRLVLWDEVGTRDEELKPRTEPAFKKLTYEPGKGKVVTTLDQGPIIHPNTGHVYGLAKAYLEQTPGIGKKLEKLIGSKNSVIETDLGELVWLNVWQHGAGPMMSVQLVNYQIDTEADKANPCENFTIRLRVPANAKYERADYFFADYITHGAEPPESIQLAFEQKDSFVEVKVPRLDIFGIVVFSTKEELAARTAAAAVRKWYQRLKIAKRCPGQNIDDASPLLQKAKNYLDGIQGDANVANFTPLLEPDRELAKQLHQNLKITTDQVTADRGKPCQDLNVAQAFKKFDFGSQRTLPAWTAVGIDTAYNSDRGYGWTSNGPLSVVDYKQSDSVHSDHVREKNPADYIKVNPDIERGRQGNSYHPVLLPPKNEGRFRIDLPNGTYMVTVVVGDYESHYSQNRTGITYVDAEGLPVIYGDCLYAGYFQNRVFETEVKDGSLDLRFWGRNVGPMYQNNCQWLVNAVVVRKASEPLTASENEYLTTAKTQSTATICNWYVLGPFDDEDCTGLDTIFGPEKNTDLNANYKGKAGTIKWQKLAPLKGRTPYVSFSGLYDDIDEVAAFAMTRVYCEQATEAILIASTSQVGTAFVNGKEVFRDEYPAGLLPHEEKVAVKLNKGWNTILIKSMNHFGDEWSVRAGLLTPDGKPLADIKIGIE